MKIGTIVRLPNGRVGTVVYHGLDGYGIKWGEHNPAMEDFDGTYGNLVSPSREIPDDWPWFPDAILREPWDGCERCGWTTEQCVGEDYEIVRAPED